MTTGDRQAGGFFATIAEAALEYARMLGPRKSVEAAERAAMLTKRKSLGLQQDRHWIQKMSAMGHVSSETINKPAKLAHPAPSSWISCDKCQKWRRVAQVPTGSGKEWYCSDNVDGKYSVCNVPQEMSDAAIDNELGLGDESTTATSTAMNIVSKTAPHQHRSLYELNRHRVAESKERLHKVRIHMGLA